MNMGGQLGGALTTSLTNTRDRTTLTVGRLLFW